MNKGIWTIEEIAEEVDKLIKYTLEMKILTRYKSEKEFNIQKLSLWSFNILKKSKNKTNLGGKND